MNVYWYCEEQEKLVCDLLALQEMSMSLMKPCSYRNVAWIAVRRKRNVVRLGTLHVTWVCLHALAVVSTCICVPNEVFSVSN
jgi:hypothetical protein